MYIQKQKWPPVCHIKTIAWAIWTGLIFDKLLFLGKFLRLLRIPAEATALAAC